MIVRSFSSAIRSAYSETVVSLTTSMPFNNNRYIEEIESLDEPLLPYPGQYSVSRELRKAATARGDARFMAMWAGQGVGLFRSRPAAELVADLVEQSKQVLMRLAGDG